LISEWRELRPEALLSVEIRKDAPVAGIIAERTLTQALFNVLDNAAEASPGDVTLKAAWTTTELVITVADRGPGLDTEIISHLGKQPISTKQEGLGVGLFLAHATIERLGGSLTIHKREPAGTLVRIVLPLLPARGRGT
jgi:two-component system sensor histidine kinase RegB